MPSNGREKEGVNGPIGRAWTFVSHDIWLIEVGSLSGFRARLTRWARVVLLATRGFFRDRCMQQAAALTYMTIFSIVPTLAVVFAMAKGFGADQLLRERTIEPFLDRTFGSLASGNASSVQLREAVDDIFEHVSQTNVAALGTFGFIVLFYLIVKMLGGVERTLNEIWGIKRARSLVRKVTDYLTILVIAPVLLVIASGVTLYLRDFFGLADSNTPNPLLRLLPLVTVCFSFGFVLFTLPNTTVRAGSAIFGGVVAGLAWQLVQYLHLNGQVTLAGWNPIYSSFAALPLLLLWVYLSWTILLLGAECSFAAQNESTFSSVRQTGVVDQALREALAPRLAARVAKAFLASDDAPTAAQLALDSSVAPRVALLVLDDLVIHGLLVRTVSDEEEGYLPARDPDTITMADLFDAVRRDPAARALPASNDMDRAVDKALVDLDAIARESEANRSLRELAES